MIATRPLRIFLVGLVSGFVVLGVGIYIALALQLFGGELQEGERMTISGKAVAGEGQAFTEMACWHPDNALIGHRQPCNQGSVSVAIKYQGELIYPVKEDGTKYLCKATEILIKTLDGNDVKFEPEECNGDIKIGQKYTIEGVVEKSEAQWYIVVDRLVRE